MALSAEAIRAVRLNRGMSQGDLGKALGVSRQTVVNWENAHNAPSPLIEARLVALAEGTEQPARPETALQDAAFAAMVLSKIAQDAEQIARRAREAHDLLTQGDAAPSPTLDVAEAGAEQVLPPPVARRRRRPKG